MLVFHLTTAAALGMASSLHCIGMCGPLAAGACSTPSARAAVEGSERPSASAAPPERASGARAAEYLGGRLVGYAAAGALAGALAQPLAVGAAGGYVRLAAGVVVGLALARTAIRWLRPLEHSRLVTLGRRRGTTDRVLAAALRFIPRRGWGLGVVTAFFPCGALLGGLLAAAASGSPATGAAMMAVFALASSPALLATILLGGGLSRLLSNGGQARRVFAVAMLVFAGWTIAVPLSALARSSEPATCH